MTSSSASAAGVSDFGVRDASSPSVLPPSPSSASVLPASPSASPSSPSLASFPSSPGAAGVPGVDFSPFLRATGSPTSDSLFGATLPNSALVVNKSASGRVSATRTPKVSANSVPLIKLPRGIIHSQCHGCSFIGVKPDSCACASSHLYESVAFIAAIASGVVSALILSLSLKSKHKPV